MCPGEYKQSNETNAEKLKWQEMFSPDDTKSVQSKTKLSKKQMWRIIQTS